MKRRTTSKPVVKMTEGELERAVAEFDKEFVIDAFDEPTPKAKERWRKARRKPGRPRVGKGVKVISVSMEQRLLARCDKLAKKQGVSRARLISRGLRAVLAAEDED